MDVLIAYDGSECSYDALIDLVNGGLPSDVTAIVLTVNDGDTAEVAYEAIELLNKQFPNWTIVPVIRSGAPVEQITLEAVEKRVHLIVLGTHKRTWVERLYEKSVAKNVLLQTRSVVRIGRRRERGVHDPLRILVAVDGSRYSEAVIHEVRSRSWPSDTQLGLITLISEPTSTIYSTRDVAAEQDRARRLHQQFEELLEATGLHVSSIVREDEPIAGILREAHDWGADCIMLGARGHGTLARLMTGSVSTAVASRAECSVEIVHMREH
jgi:nucleotide-binding universal stress UspA family protein